MYTIRTVQLKNSEWTKEVPVIDFEDSAKAIVAEFLMADSSLMAEEMNDAIDRIAKGEIEFAEWTGNRCSLTIRSETTVIEDLLEGIYEAELTYPSCEIETKKLQTLIEMWLDVKKAYKT